MDPERQRKRIVALVVVSGGVIAFSQMRLRLRGVLREQRNLSESVTTTSNEKPGEKKIKSQKVSVDAQFARRLSTIMKICIPSFFCRETFYILIQSGLLVGRTLLTEKIASLEGLLAQATVTKNWDGLADCLWEFARTGVPAAFVNSGLKYMQVLISLAFRERLTKHLHQRYLANRVYYIASVLGGLSNADQRLTDEADKFCTSVSELFSYTFKPLLDIVLFTQALSKTMGYPAQLVLYSYFILCSGILRSLSPPLALLTSQESSLSGDFRAAQQRLVAHAEEVAFNDPPGGDTERLILNDHLHRLLRHSRLSAFQRFIQQIADGFLIKYSASIVGISVYAAPIYFAKDDRESTAGDYIHSARLMMSTATAIGQLVLLYKRINSLAGVTSRVSELLETIQQLGSKDGISRTIHAHAIETHEAGEESRVPSDAPPPKLLFGDVIRFDRVTIRSPDRTVLVSDLCFAVSPGGSVIIMGPNGSGKSSLFRVLAELWPLEFGIVTRPPRGQIFYLSQKPYLVRGSLRDQVRYPLAPRAIARAAYSGHNRWRKGKRGQSSSSSSRRNLAQGTEHSAGGGGSSSADLDVDVDDDARILAALEATQIGYLTGRGKGLDQVQSFEETLSGGERQRLAVARVLYHRPRFAVLDECTSAVSADGEDHLYRELRGAGITLLSIAHRPALVKYHEYILEFDGSKVGKGWNYRAIGS